MPPHSSLLHFFTQINEIETFIGVSIRSISCEPMGSRDLSEGYLSRSNKMKTRTIAILTLATVVLVGGMFAVGQHVVRGVSRGRGGERGPIMALRGLNLTDDQRAKVKEILDANGSTIEPIREQMKTAHEKLAALNGNFDEAQVSAIAREQGALTAELIIARERVKSQIFAILTDDQKAKAAQIQRDMQQRFQNRTKFWGEKRDAGKGVDDEEQPTVRLSPNGLVFKIARPFYFSTKTPPIIVNLILPSASIATRSARFPTSIEPIVSFNPINAAGFDEAILATSM